MFAKYSLPSIAIHKFLTRGFSQTQIKHKIAEYLHLYYVQTSFLLLIKQYRTTTVYIIFNIVSNSRDLKCHEDVHESYANSVPSYVRDLGILGCWVRKTPEPVLQGPCDSLHLVNTRIWTHPIPREHGALTYHILPASLEEPVSIYTVIRYT